MKLTPQKQEGGVYSMIKNS